MIITMRSKLLNVISLSLILLPGLCGCSDPPDDADLADGLENSYADYMRIVTQCGQYPELQEIDSKNIERRNGAPQQYAKLTAADAEVYDSIQKTVGQLGVLWVRCERDKDDPKHSLEAVSFEFYHSQLTTYGPRSDKGIEYLFVDEANQKRLVAQGWDTPMQRKNWYYYRFSN